MECRPKCAACCIYISISSAMPGYPNGKPAGVPCMHLNENLECTIFNSELRPKVCGDFKAEKLVCGDTAEEAREILSNLEKG